MASDILIVDDEADIRELVADILQDEGYDTRTAHDSDEALSAVDAHQPNLVLLDIWLQGSRLDGLQLLDSLKQQHPELPVVMISGHGNIEAAVTAIKRGAYDFIEKPFKADRLMSTAERAVKSGVADVRVAPSSPWSIEELAACFVVWDGNGEVFATVYYEQDPFRRAPTKLPTKDVGRRIAVQVAKLSELHYAGGIVPTQTPPALTAGSFLRPWSVEDIGDAFVVRDSIRQKLAYVYYEEEPGRRRAAKLLTKDEARRIAANVAKLPELLQNE